jgi:hypothetical protein
MLGLVMHIIAKMSRDCAQQTRHVSQRQLYSMHTQQADALSKAAPQQALTFWPSDSSAITVVCILPLTPYLCR